VTLPQHQVLLAADHALSCLVYTATFGYLPAGYDIGRYSGGRFHDLGIDVNDFLDPNPYEWTGCISVLFQPRYSQKNQKKLPMHEAFPIFKFEIHQITGNIA
jgi:hypothetical protein